MNVAAATDVPPNAMGESGGWSIAPVPWLEPTAHDGLCFGMDDVAEVRGGAEPLRQGKLDELGCSLFNESDNWGQPLAEEPFMQNLDKSEASLAHNPPGDTSFCQTLVGHSKFVSADGPPFGGATWRGNAAATNQNTLPRAADSLGMDDFATPLQSNRLGSASIRPSNSTFDPLRKVPEENVESETCQNIASPKRNYGNFESTDATTAMPSEPVKMLEAAVAAIHDARGEVGHAPVVGLSAPIGHGFESDLVSARAAADFDDSFRIPPSEVGRKEERAVAFDSGAIRHDCPTDFGLNHAPDAGAAPANSARMPESGQSWGNVLRQFGGNCGDGGSGGGGGGADDSGGGWASKNADSPNTLFGQSSHFGDSIPRNPGGYPRGGDLSLGASVASSASNVFTDKPLQSRAARSHGVEDPASNPRDGIGRFHTSVTPAGRSAGQAPIDGIGSERSLHADDFANIAGADPEDFDAFLARLRSQVGSSSVAHTEAVSGSANAGGGVTSVRGTRPPFLASDALPHSPPSDPLASVPGASRRERVRTGSPILRSAAGAVLRSGSMDSRPLRPGSGGSGRPGSGGSVASAGSNLPSLRELRQQRRKPRTAEDVLLGGDVESNSGIASGGPGIGLHATAVAHRGHEHTALEALRASRRPPSRDLSRAG